MSLYHIQGNAEKAAGIYYEFNSDEQPLGEGGMGKVYKGRCINEQTGQSRLVAVKFLYSDLPPYAIEKARREAAIQLKHANLIEMLGFIETESKTVLGEIERHYHVVSELLQGVTLDCLFEGKLTDQEGRPVPYAEKLHKDYKQDCEHFAVEIVKCVLSGLITMHDAGYIHRDIDPTNIMITSDGLIKLIDFGIAKKTNNLTSQDKHLTQAGQFVGKPEYAAPELVLGAINEQNQTTDIYAMGILLFQCIVGHTPFEGDRNEILQKQLHKPLPLKLIKHKGIRRIIKKATNKSRSERYQSAAEFRVALEKLDLHDDSIRFSWKPLYTYITGTAALCGALGFTIAIWSDSNPNPEPTPSQTIPPTYATAVNYLNVDSTATKGLNLLKDLAREGDGKANFLLGQLYFQSNLKDEFSPDSVTSMRKKLNLRTDNLAAHEFLKNAIRNDTMLYQAYYELALNYWKAKQRTEAVNTRDGDLAKKYFLHARKYAVLVGDKSLVGQIDYYLSRIDMWKEKVEQYNTER